MRWLLSILLWLAARIRPLRLVAVCLSVVAVVLPLHVNAQATSPAIRLLTTGPPLPTLDCNFAVDQNLGCRRGGVTVSFTRATTATYFDRTGTLQTAASGTPRFDYSPSTLQPLGFLIEEQRTNSIRNSTMVGAAAGTPGTLPTNWSVASNDGLTTDVIGTGTANGVAYIEIRVHGTTNSTFYVLSFDNAAVISASAGQTWAGTMYAAITGGDLSGISALNTRVNYAGANTSQLVEFSALTATLTRQPENVFLAAASTTGANLSLQFATGNGVAINITLRIGLPQLELGSFATSPIPTTNAAVTRNADVLVISQLAPWFNASEGTFVAQFIPNTDVSNPASQVIVSVGDGTTTNRIMIYRVTTSGRTAFLVASAASGAYVNNNGLPVISQGATGKSAASYRNADYSLYTNGTSVLSSTAVGTIPTVSSMTIGIRSDSANTTQLNGWLQRLQYYPRRLSDARLQQLAQ